MAWIGVVDESDADGLLAAMYAEAVRRAGKVFNILKVQSVNPPVMRAGVGLYTAAVHGRSPLTRRLREMVATVVSRANECHY
ncbi:MAG: peroxidase [Phycisphaerales bacterium]|nr:MAG: peroxidase [Phycisphaerales bacterium]